MPEENFVAGERIPPDRLVARQVPRLRLERVVSIEVRASKQRRERGRQVSERERDAPALPLTDMDELVLESSLVEVIDAQHDVTKSHRPVPEADPPRPMGTFANHDSPHGSSVPEERSQQKTGHRAGRRPQNPPRQPHHRGACAYSGTSERTMMRGSVISSIAYRSPSRPAPESLDPP